MLGGPGDKSLVRRPTHVGEGDPIMIRRAVAGVIARAESPS